jgi:hypothetical protein
MDRKNIFPCDAIHWAPEVEQLKIGHLSLVVLLPSGEEE